MKRNIFRNIILCLLTALFIGAGVHFMMLRIEKETTWKNAVGQAETMVENLDGSELDALKQENAVLSEEIGAMDSQMAALQAEITALEQNSAQLQQEYDQLAQQEDTVYYQTIFQSLTEGMNLVESYINGDE